MQDASRFILFMLTPEPPFASIDYKEVMEEFYKRVPRALAHIVSPIQNDNIEKIERLMQNADYELLLERSVYDSKFKVTNPLLSRSKELFRL